MDAEEEDMEDQALESMRSPWVTTLTYDEQGRCTQRETMFSGQTVHKVESEYDDLGNPIQQRITSPGSPGDKRELRYEYVYDAVGNWTERVIRTKLDGGTTLS
jgi:YD repeat-containing protein